MCHRGIDALGVSKISTQQLTRGARSVIRRVEIMLHDERLFRTTVAKCTTENEILPLWPLSLWEVQSLKLFGTGVLRLSPGDGYGKTARAIDSVICAFAKKTGRKIKFSSRVEVRGCDPESFRNRYQTSGLNASFSSLIFSSLLSFSLPSTIPPFQSATCGDV
jgi:hypothetical protein